MLDRIFLGTGSLLAALLVDCTFLASSPGYKAPIAYLRPSGIGESLLPLIVSIVLEIYQLIHRWYILVRIRIF